MRSEHPRERRPTTRAGRRRGSGVSSLIVGSVAVALLAGCSLTARDVKFASLGPGTSKENAIEVCRPAGERAYLSQLRCPDGDVPEFDRIGSYGRRTQPLPGAPSVGVTDSLRDPERRVQPGEVDIHVIDGYRVVCDGEAYLVFLDMYHCGDPPTSVVPPGFSMGR